MAVVAEYIWLDVNKNLRSKTKVITDGETVEKVFSRDGLTPQTLAAYLPNWNYDGSSTGQAEGLNSELILKPVAVYDDPSREGILVMCGTYDKDGIPLPSNYRDKAESLFNANLEQEPWFGIEQEYFAFKSVDKKNLIRAELSPSARESLPAIEQGKYYCSVGMGKAFYRELVDQHLYDCLSAGLKISGINAEVAPYQWEYQIGPCTGIEAGDEVWISRYLLERLAEKYDVEICYQPKPFKKLNGSGCHTNFSTKSMREDNGIEEIFSAITKLSEKHVEHMSVYGDGNNERMSGLYETSKYDVFSFDIKRPVDRGASVRIGWDTIKNRRGYFEDRRPASTMDPYIVTSKLFETVVLN
tara:strand:+ start:19500 stop:20570 length:1071 start_codon:yes stop_codon:yes gene_type:complete